MQSGRLQASERHGQSAPRQPAAPLEEDWSTRISRPPAVVPAALAPLLRRPGAAPQLTRQPAATVTATLYPCRHTVKGPQDKIVGQTWILCPACQQLGRIEGITGITPEPMGAVVDFDRWIERPVPPPATTKVSRPGLVTQALTATRKALRAS